ncbi:hypothetical protein FMN50_02155 [Rhodobacterales bacterium]|nr:hypothetical protein FMN50_02155 [Rhodobacterales bacterium]
MLFLARDRSSGKSFAINRALAFSLRKARAALLGTGQLDGLEQSQARDIYQFLHLLQMMRKSDLAPRKAFNPVFMSFALFDVGVYQRRLAPLARLFVSNGFLFMMAALMAVCCALGVRNDWAIISAFDSVFSLEAIVTFGIAAPFLKVIHELGHVLTATRYGVAVRKAGFYLVGFYPMPYVDCSDADFSARRRHRVAISLAGIIVDVAIGMVAFIGWHYSAGTYLQTLLGNIFVFSTLNSILFNANPLVKLDGYFAFSDAIGNRNLSTRGQMALGDLRRWLMSFGREGAMPSTGKAAGLAAYAVASVAYRINMLLTIALGLAPLYLGLGMVAVTWGAIAMFQTPMQNMVKRAVLSGSPTTADVWLKRGLALAVLAALIAFVPFPFTTVVPVTLDTGGQYKIHAATTGFLREIRANGPVKAGEPVLVMVSPTLEKQREVLRLEAAEAELNFRSLRGVDQTKARAALREVESLNERLVLAEETLAALRVKAARAGTFIDFGKARVGQHLRAGTAVGSLLPNEGPAILVGSFPERYVAKFQHALVAADLRLDGRYHALPPNTVEMQAVLKVDRSSGTRSYRIRLPFEVSPTSVVGSQGDIRFRFRSEPLWAHVRFWLDTLLANFRQSELADHEKYLSR